MKTYEIYVDGMLAGISELTKEEVALLNNDATIRVKKVRAK